MGANMLGLAILGPFVERTVGRFSYLFLYLLFGIGSSVFVIVCTVTGLINESFLVGASGAVLGLIGATAAILLRAWKKTKGKL